MSVMDIEDRLTEQVEALRARASQLRQQAGQLEVEANALERQIAEKPVEHVTIKPVQRGREISLRDLEATMDALEALAPCTSTQLAERLGISQGQAVTRLTRLKQLGNAASRGIASGTVWEVGTGEPESNPSLHLQDHSIPVRDVGRRLGEFTVAQVHAEIPDATYDTVGRWVKRWTERGLFERLPKQGGRNEEYRYRVVKVEGETRARPRQETPENQVRRVAIPRGGTIAGTGRQIGAGEGQRTRDLIGRVERAGGSAKHGKRHLKLYDAQGKLITSVSRGGSKTYSSGGQKATDKVVPDTK